MRRISVVVVATFIALVVAAPMASAASPPGISVDPNRANFRRVPVTQLATIPLTITNTSSQDIIFSWNFSGDTDQFGYTTTTCQAPAFNTQLAPGGSCVINLSFVAQAADRYSATLSIAWAPLGGSATIKTVAERATAI